MSLHESIIADLNRLVDEQGAVDIISPTLLALAAQRLYGTQASPPQIAYASLEHLKQMARRVLSGRYDAESDEAEALQGEMFSGQLQRRYPTPHKRGEDPQYKLLETMSDIEIQWNEDTLQRSADARALHAQALRAYRLSRVDCAA